MNTKAKAIESLKTLKPFIGNSQLYSVKSGCNGEEKQFFYGKLSEMADTVANMPETYGQDGKGDQAIAYLHYYIGNADWYITERDSDLDGEGQIQAFGYVDLGYGGELGYISIPELLANNVELDFFFEPKTIGDIKKLSS